MGFIIGFPSSPRNLIIDRAKELFSRVPGFVETVAVTVPGSLNMLLEIEEKLSPDVFQIHGGKIDPKKIRESLSRPKLVKATSVKAEEINLDLSDTVFFDAVLLDSYSEGKYGGTGTVHNWEVSRQFKERIYPKPLILAGGLTPENVGEAISMVKPYAVDVSTGVEQKPGIKDKAKIFQFIKNARKVCL